MRAERHESRARAGATTAAGCCLTLHSHKLTKSLLMALDEPCVLNWVSKASSCPLHKTPDIKPSSNSNKLSSISSSPYDGPKLKNCFLKVYDTDAPEKSRICGLVSLLIIGAIASYGLTESHETHFKNYINNSGLSRYLKLKTSNLYFLDLLYSN